MGPYAVAISEATYDRLKRAAIGAGRSWAHTKTDTGKYILEVDPEVFALIKKNPDAIINQQLDLHGEE